MLELVAPAGDMDSFRLAVANGADAVYAGGKSFSARQYAANFALDELAAAIRLAHLHRVRVYVTINTLLRREEMEEAVAQARAVHEAGADAVIVQDLGLLLELRRLVPDLRLHASTQMTVVNAATLAELAKLGICRAVLAREATEEEVRAMAAVGPEIEVFVHGALCYSYSGQCLMSSIIGGRSGNRGRCAQPCRLEYTLEGPGAEKAAVGKYLLSPRDLCLLPHLDRLAAAGVHALKLEGRMKRPEYVATAVRVYRQALDRLAAGDFSPLPEEERDLAQIFNRGFTAGFFRGDQGLAYLSHRRPNNRGLPIGRVVAAERSGGRIALSLAERVQAGDNVEIWVSKGGRVSTTLAGLERDGRPAAGAEAGETVTIPWHEGVRAGDRVFRTRDALLSERALAPLAAGGPLLPFDARVVVRPGQPVSLMLADTDGNQVEVVGELPGQPARNRPLTEETVREHLARTGGSNWTPRRIEVDLAPATMVPISELNRLRRAGLAALEEARLRAWPRPPACPAACEGEGRAAARTEREMSLSGTVGCPGEAWAALAGGIDRLYLAAWMHPWPDEELSALVALARREAAFLIYALPRVAPERERPYWLAEIDRARSLGLDGVRAGDLGLAAAAAAKGWANRIHLDFSLNIMNPWTMRHLSRNAAGVALSPELTLTQARDLAGAAAVRAEIIVHGRLEMMLSAHCLLGALLGGKRNPGQACGRPCERGEFALRDRMGAVFPLRPDRFCRLHVENSVDLSVLPVLDQFAGSGCDLRLEMQGRGAPYVEAVVRAYRGGLRALARGEWTPAKGKKAESALASYSPRGFTRGHFFRGVE